MRSSPPDGAWVAVYVHSNTERKVFGGLRENGYEAFLPTYKDLRTRCDRRVQLDLPLFRGYVFCRWQGQNRQPIVRIPGVIRIVGFGGIPASIEEAELNAVRRIAESGAASMPWKFIRAGERVTVTSGPLMGLEGSFVRISGGNYVTVNVSLMGRAVATRIQLSQLAPRKGLESLGGTVANRIGPSQRLGETRHSGLL